MEELIEKKEYSTDSKNSFVENRNRNQNGMLMIMMAIMGLVVIYLVF
jgi:hypothetical protein